MAILYEKREGIARIKFNRPEVLNALNPEAVDNLVELLGDAAGDTEVKAVVISGTGRSFCAGWDLKVAQEEFSDVQSGKMTALEIAETSTEGLQEVARLIRYCDKPVIAACHGYAVGAGCEIAIDCDLIVAAEGTRFGFPELSAGLSITGGVTKLLPMIVGLNKARELAFTGEFIDAEEACAGSRISSQNIPRIVCRWRRQATRIRRRSPKGD